MSKYFNRLTRGKLKNFEDLPIDVKSNFKNIKKNIDSLYNKKVDVEIFGSFYRGNWCESSDYDVVIIEPGLNCFVVSKTITEKLGFKVDIFYSKQKINTILIP